MNKNQMILLLAMPLLSLATQHPSPENVNINVTIANYHDAHAHQQTTTIPVQSVKKITQEEQNKPENKNQPHQESTGATIVGVASGILVSLLWGIPQTIVRTVMEEVICKMPPPPF